MNIAQPIFKPIALGDASKYSPWPDRITGKAPWKKPDRNAAEDKEYDRGWFAELTQKWERYIHEHTGKPNPVTALAFYEILRADRNKAFVENKAVYGDVDLDAYLMCMADTLFLGSFNLFESFYRLFILENIRTAQRKVPFDVLVEPGCGNGINLFNAFLHLPLSSIVGMDRSSNAVDFLKKMASDTGVPGQFNQCDIRDVKTMAQSFPAEQKWALLSAGTFQLIPEIPPEWFREITQTPNPPAAGIFFEPVVWGDNGEYPEYCAKYSEINGYNTDLGEKLMRAEAHGIIEILSIHKRALGTSAFGPTSMVVWKPIL